MTDKAIYEQDPLLCPQCSDPIPWEKRNRVVCCSKVCAGYLAKGLLYSKKRPRACPRCESVVPGGQVFCSKTCQWSTEWEERKASYISAGEIVGGAPKTIRRFLFDTRAHKCEICNRATWNGDPIPLVADHINGNPTDHRIANLRLVCPNCDAQLPTSKGRNKGNGRASRRSFYDKNGYC